MSTRATRFFDFLHFKGWPFINHKISLQFERYHDHFFDFSKSFYDASSYGSTFKIPSINDGLNPNLKRGAKRSFSKEDAEKTTERIYIPLIDKTS